MSKDLFNNVSIAPLWDPIDLGTGDTAKVSEIIDMQGASSLLILLAFGSIADSDVTFTVLVEDGDDSSLTDNAAVADAYLHGTEALATPTFGDDNKVFKIGYTGPKRYVRVTLTPANNTGAILTCAIAVRGNLNQLPNTTQEV